MHGCGWDSGAARERSSALAASVASRYALGADGVGAARPGARGSRVTASRYALGAEGGGAARPGAYMCPPRNCARCLLGGVGMSKKSCAARCSRGSVQGVLRAPAEGEGGVAHREDLAATASATLERSTGTVAHGKRAARERRRRRSPCSFLLWILTHKRFHSNLAIAPTCDTVSTYHITDNARDPQRGLSRAT